MFNEFIVWDEKNKNFGQHNVGKDMSINDFFKFFELSRYFSIHNYIGKIDIEQNKIYENCSIVEFEHKSSRTVLKYETGYIAKQAFIEFESIVFKAYFQYHTDELRYELIILDYDKSKTDSIFSVLSFNMETMSNFKVIGTLQEDKHLLGDTDEN